MIFDARTALTPVSCPPTPSKGAKHSPNDTLLLRPLSLHRLPSHSSVPANGFAHEDHTPLLPPQVTKRMPGAGLQTNVISKHYSKKDLAGARNWGRCRETVRFLYRPLPLTGSGKAAAGRLADGEKLRNRQHLMSRREKGL